MMASWQLCLSSAALSAGASSRQMRCPGLMPSLVANSAIFALQVGHGQAVHAAGQEQFAAVMQVVLQHVPDNPLARLYPIVARWEWLIEVGGRPARQALMHDVPGGFQPLHQFGGALLHWVYIIPGYQWP